VVRDAPPGSTVLGAEPGLSQSIAEASSDGLAGLPAILSGALPPDPYTVKLCKQQLSTLMLCKTNSSTMHAAE